MNRKYQDLTGQKFFRLTVLYRADDFIAKSGKKRIVWHCVCDCGNETDVLAQNLVSGSTKSCGCYNREAAHNRKVVDLTGQRFGKLLVISEANIRVRQNGAKETTWLCKCDCGNETIVRASALNTGNTKSCGCLQKEKAAEHIMAINKKHGECYTRLYNIWTQMRGRCFSPTSTEYKQYGGRGISVCVEWKSYENFKNWAYANGYSPELTIDRIDVNGNYCPENCRWATCLMQQNNRTNNHYLKTPDGELLSMAECSRKYNIPYYALRSRIHRGWSDTKALTTPLNIQNRKGGDAG